MDGVEAESRGLINSGKNQSNASVSDTDPFKQESPKLNPITQSIIDRITKKVTAPPTPVTPAVEPATTTPPTPPTPATPAVEPATTTPPTPPTPATPAVEPATTTPPTPPTPATPSESPQTPAETKPEDKAPTKTDLQKSIDQVKTGKNLGRFKENNPEAVKEVQERLKKDLGLGDDFKIDGKFGPDTADKLKEWQKRNSIKADGMAGIETLEKMQGEPVKEFDNIKKARDLAKLVTTGNATPTGEIPPDKSQNIPDARNKNTGKGK